MNLLRLDSPVSELDFRHGMWGHKLHFATFREETRPPIKLPRYPWWKWWKRKGDEARLNAEAERQDVREMARRYSFMVHSMHFPRVGMQVVWRGNKDDVRGTLYAYDRAPNVDDTFTLKVRVTA